MWGSGGWVVMWSGNCGVEPAVWNSQLTDFNSGTGGRVVGTHLSSVAIWIEATVSHIFEAMNPSK